MPLRNRALRGPVGPLVLGVGFGLLLVGFWAAYTPSTPPPCAGPLACTYAPTVYPQPIGVLLLFVGISLMFWWALAVGLVGLLGRYVPTRTSAPPQSR